MLNKMLIILRLAYICTKKWALLIPFEAVGMPIKSISHVHIRNGRLLTYFDLILKLPTFRRVK